MTSPDLEARRRHIHQRALGNLFLILLAEARNTAGRLQVQPFVKDALILSYRDVLTLVRASGVFRIQSRDFSVILGFPASWPFDRAAALKPFVLEPDDFAAPNSDGLHLCLDLQGILPERLPSLLYDNLRVKRFRLDDSVDREAAAFVRSHPGDFPADRRPLYSGEGGLKEDA